MKPVAVLLLLVSILAVPAHADSFINFESVHVSPIDITPDQTKLLAVNTADNRLEVFDITGRLPVSLGSVAVGLDPVSVRARNDNEAWVVNHISDSVSVIDLTTMNVVKTVQTGDEPADVIFAGTPERAYVSISQENKVSVFDVDNPTSPLFDIAIQGEEPRMLAKSRNGGQVYVAIFESGNNSTIIGVHQGANVVSTAGGPYGGQNPPPNDGTEFVPSINPDLSTEPPKMGLIVRKDATGKWMDDNNGDWSEFVTGTNASRTDRFTGWDVVDNDVAVIQTSNQSVTYHTGMMNLIMAIDANPRTGQITAVGTEATNERRFEPNLTARFVRVHMATGNRTNLSSSTIVDLNPHLDYSDAQVAQQANPATHDHALVEQSIGDPRAFKWNSRGNQAYVAGMGSNNVVVVDQSGNRVGAPIVVGEGPTGIAVDRVRNRLYVLNKFDASISVVNVRNNSVLTTLSMFDPTPAAIKTGRKHLYNTHNTSGLGQISCASCHIDARHDRIAWDLGNPAGSMTTFTERNCGYGVETDRECHDFHPMKGPMLTQTLQDIIGHEPHHWRGDKLGLEEFNGAFTGLQGAPAELTDTEMQEFEDFLATIYFPPNPYRNFDNTLPSSLDLSEFESFGRFERDGGLSPGEPLPPGNANAGLDLYRTRPVHMAGPGGSDRRDNTCAMCHTLPTGMGANVTFVGDINRFPEAGSGEYIYNTDGPKGEKKLMVTGLLFGGDNQVNTFKVPQLRSIYDRRGFTLKKGPALSGFGYFHDGSDTLDKFFGRFVGLNNDQEVADIIAFMMAFSGSELPMGDLTTLEEPPGPSSQDAHAAVGAQITVTDTNKNNADVLARLDEMLSIADLGVVGFVAHGITNGERHGFTYIGGNLFISDAAEMIGIGDLKNAIAGGEQITFTVVPIGTETRIGIDRDEDGIVDALDSVIQ